MQKEDKIKLQNREKVLTIFKQVNRKIRVRARSQSADRQS